MTDVTHRAPTPPRPNDPTTQAPARRPHTAEAE